MQPRIWLSSPHQSGKELDFIHDAFAHNWIAPLGPNVDGFEQDLVDYLGQGRYVAALSAGTAALHLSLVLLGVQRGERVICQSMTFSATANPIAYVGAEPVFVDSEPETWNMSPRYLEEAITDSIRQGKKPRAIMLVHLYGMPAKIDEVLAVAAKYDIPVVEDAAEALGSTYRGQKCGTFGALGILSFNGNKIITTSGGGALVCPTKELADKARFLSTQARDQAPHYQHSHIGYNYRMSNVCAGVGRGQMTALADRVTARHANNLFYQQALAGLPGITVHTEPGTEFYSNHWLTCILVDPEQTGGVTREDIRLKLWEQAIESRPLWKPMHLQPVFEGCPFYGDGTSEALFDRGLCLPSGSNLSQAELDEIAGVIRGMVRG